MLSTLRHNLYQLWLAVDQLLNVLLCSVIVPCEKSWADETFSSRCHRWNADGKYGWPRKVVNAIFFNQKDHCRSAYTNELKRVQSPPEMRG